MSDKPYIRDRGVPRDPPPADFTSFGELVDPQDVPALVVAGRIVWSFGYGDEPGIYTTIDKDDLWAWIGNSSLADATVRSWAPFRVAPATGNQARTEPLDRLADEAWMALWRDMRRLPDASPSDLLGTHRPLIEAAVRSAEAREAARLRSALNDTARRWHGGEHHGPAGVFEECLNPVCIRNLPLMAGGVSRALTVDVGAVTPPPVATLGEAMGVMDADEAATLRRLSVKP